MKLVKDNSHGAWAIRVPCVGPQHDTLAAKDGRPASRMFTLAEGYADIEGRAFVDYYCNACATAAMKAAPLAG